MDVTQASANLPLLVLRLRITPKQVLKLPAANKGNTLRGAFGGALRRLVCIPQWRDARQCPLDGVCPYRLIFEPSPPPGADRLSKNQDTPRPFVFQPPLGSQATYNAGEAFDFSLTLLGKAVHYLPYFVLAFREVAREGIGLNRAPCELEQVESLAPESTALEPANEEVCPLPLGGEGDPQPALSSAGAGRVRGLLPLDPQVIYNRQEDLFRQPASLTLADWVRPRLLEWTNANRRFRVSFLTPTYLKFNEQAVLKPDFHHLFKRVRDRLNAVCTFFGPGPIDADFKALGERAEQVRTVNSDVHWLERSRRSSKTGQRHELSGFIGECTYELPPTESESCNLELLRWIICGELLHAGRHTAWGNGWYVANSGGVT
ncbi:MAG: CRISPR system precrRNA processing endoribonuclease RAMP protein Cas6 [Terriglobia bacterium]|jgi:hypothetical protein